MDYFQKQFEVVKDLHPHSRLRNYGLFFDNGNMWYIIDLLPGICLGKYLAYEEDTADILEETSLDYPFVILIDDNGGYWNDNILIENLANFIMDILPIYKDITFKKVSGGKIVL